VEQDIEKLLEDARISDIALLVVGDPFSATTRKFGIFTTICYWSNIFRHRYTAPGKENPSSR
jgi:hypothetical protein